MDIEKPYFLTSTSWYYYDTEDGKYKLTEEATKEAIESYNEFYSLLDEQISKTV